MAATNIYISSIKGDNKTAPNSKFLGEDLIGLTWSGTTPGPFNFGQAGEFMLQEHGFYSNPVYQAWEVMLPKKERGQGRLCSSGF